MRAMYAQVGRWYQDLQTGTVFEVVAIDDNADTVEAQLIDGALLEYDRDSWDQLLLEQVEEPEDWREAYELSQEDKRDPDQPFRPDNGDPLDRVEPDIINGLGDDPG